MKTTCIIMEEPNLKAVWNEMEGIRRIVQTATSALAVRIRTNAPRKSGDLIAGIVASPWEENSAYPGKIVRQVYMDAGMNDTFVKVTKNGKRYYYPASQEFGFQKRSSGYIKAWYYQDLKKPAYRERAKAFKERNRVPGKFFMNDTFVEYIPAFEGDVVKFVDKVVAND